MPKSEIPRKAGSEYGSGGSDLLEAIGEVVAGSLLCEYTEEAVGIVVKGLISERPEAAESGSGVSEVGVEGASFCGTPDPAC